MTASAIWRGAAMQKLLLLLAGLLLLCQDSDCSLGQGSVVERQPRRELQARSHRHREGRRPQTSRAVNSEPAFFSDKSYSDWDGQPSWEWDNPKTLYFEPVAGLGNRLRALSSAVVVAREAGVGLKVIWREEVECGPDCGNIPPFNSTWPDLFSYPNLRLAPNFPGIREVESLQAARLQLQNSATAFKEGQEPDIHHIAF